ncbi:MAG: hypothetical protein PUE97_07265 [Subdoligranulum variabile]|nr:hypothetical protein [Subdoligranulum variabile]
MYTNCRAFFLQEHLCNVQYLERAYHEAEANRKIASGEGGNPNGSFNKSDLVNALNYMDLTNEERRTYFSIVAPTWKNPY